MNYSEVKELLTAGFTAEEIRQMMSVNPQDENPQNSQENPQPEQPEEQPQDDAKFNQLNATMEKLIRTIQSSNLNNSSFDTITKPDLNAEVDKIMAGIIRPERDKKEV